MVMNVKFMIKMKVQKKSRLRRREKVIIFSLMLMLQACLKCFMLKDKIMQLHEQNEEVTSSNLTSITMVCQFNYFNPITLAPSRRMAMNFQGTKDNRLFPRFWNGHGWPIITS